MISEKLSGTRASLCLDFIRGSAALAVLCGHIRGLMFVDSHKIKNGLTSMLRAIYFMTSLGHQAVMIFFVLSGFLVSSSVIKARAGGCWSWRWYLTNRLTRLYIVLLPALLLGGAFDRMGLHFFGSGGIYGGHAGNSVIYFAVARRLGIKEFCGNLFFLQTIVVPTMGSNGALWSLANEFWYYLIFAFVSAAIYEKRAGASGFSLFCALFSAYFCGRQIMLYFLIWLMGVALNFFPLGIRKRGILTLVSAGIFLMSLLVAKANILSGWWSDFTVGLATTVFIFTLLQHRNPIGKNGFSKSVHILSSISYTVYLVHLPFVVFLASFMLSKYDTRWQPDIVHLSYGVGVVTLAVGYSWILASFTEARTSKAREILSYMLDCLLSPAVA